MLASNLKMEEKKMLEKPVPLRISCAIANKETLKSLIIKLKIKLCKETLKYFSPFIPVVS